MTVLMAAVVLGLAAGCDDDATGPETVPPLAPLQGAA